MTQMTLGLSHFEIKARDLERLEDFYTRVLGFIVTDRSLPGAYRMVFLSLNPGEHHQIVLAQADGGDFGAGSLDHLAFRADGLPALRRHHQALQTYGGLAVETVSHGTTWSLYFRDPEGNRLEIFADTPWHVAQPLRFPIDLAMADRELIAWTERQIAALADFQPAEDWFDGLEGRLTGKGPDQV
jgi:catechol-2,3-dioxygenase